MNIDNSSADFSRRSFYLDGVRGLAAASVVLLHLLSVFLDTQYPRYAGFDHILKAASYTPLCALWTGSAVIAFFILSGYALHRMLSGERWTYGSYLVRRILRLWIPYIVVVAFAAASVIFIGSHKIPGQSGWLNSFLAPSLGWPVIANHVAMIGVFDTRPLDFVIWSLVIEMRISLLFPLIFWTVDHLPARVVLVVSLLLGGLAAYSNPFADTSISSVISTLGNHTYFVIGALLSRHETEVRVWYQRLRKDVRIAGLVVAIALYCNCFRLSATYSTMLGGTWLIIVALCSRKAQMGLMLPVVQWLGRMSYSIYIVHGVVLLTLINLLYPRLSFLAVVLIAAPTIPLAAFVLYTTVEYPSMKLSRQAGRWIESYAAGNAPKARNTADQRAA